MASAAILVLSLLVMVSGRSISRSPPGPSAVRKVADIPSAFNLYKSGGANLPGSTLGHALVVVHVGLKPSNQTALLASLAASGDPTSPTYGQHLSKSQVRRRTLCHDLVHIN